MRHGLRGRAEHLDPGAQIGERRGQPLARGRVPRVGAKRSSERVRGFGEHPVRLEQRPESPARQRVVRHAPDDEIVRVVRVVQSAQGLEAQTPLRDGVEVTRLEGERGVDGRERFPGAAARLEHLGDAHEPGGLRGGFRRRRRRRRHRRVRRRRLCRLRAGWGGRRVAAMLREVVLAEIFARSLVLLVGGRARRVHAARGRVGETRG
mmetsp:Transcript_1794/g.7470  ORF Transcript_1794/g.7470 Transcript_1794/m.7470 type:complete len:207 (-) Transcript_1794:172-792(-)